jgi:hypothetical protein
VLLSTSSRLLPADCVRVGGIPALLIFEFALTVLVVVPIMLYFPNAPPTPPTPSAAATRCSSAAAPMPLMQSIGAFLRDIATVCRNPSFTAVVLCGA